MNNRIESLVEEFALMFKGDKDWFMKFDSQGMALTNWLRTALTTIVDESFEKGRLAMGKEILESKEFKTLEERLPNPSESNEYQRAYRLRYFAQNPWARKYSTSIGRARRLGREHTMKVADFKELWFRDEAWKLKEPSIDRIDNKKGYIKENCRFIELKEKNGRNNIGRPPSEFQRETSRRNMQKFADKQRKLSDTQITEIRTLLASGQTQLAIAKKYGVVQQIISRIKLNER